MEIDEKDVLSFGQGILGFEHLARFFIVDPGDETLIMWLQSLGDGSVAFPIIEPQIFQLSYRVKLLPFELRGLGLPDAATAKIYAILTIPKDITQMSANLKAPIVINAKKSIARQIVLQDNKLSVRHEMYPALKAHIISMANVQSKRAEGKPVSVRPQAMSSNNG